MKQKKKSSVKDKKQLPPKEMLVGFLRLLNAVSISPDVLEFCTPGHKAGRGFVTVLTMESANLLPLSSEELG